MLPNHHTLMLPPAYLPPNTSVLMERRRVLYSPQGPTHNSGFVSQSTRLRILSSSPEQLIVLGPPLIIHISTTRDLSNHRLFVFFCLKITYLLYVTTGFSNSLTFVIVLYICYPLILLNSISLVFY